MDPRAPAAIDFKPDLIGFSRGERVGVGNHQRIGISYEPRKNFVNDLSVKRPEEKGLFMSKKDVAF